MSVVLRGVKLNPPANLEVKMQAVDYEKVKEMDRLVELCEHRNKLCGLQWCSH